MWLPNLGADSNGTVLRLIDDGLALPVFARVRQRVHRARSRQRRNWQPNARPFGPGGMACGEPAGGILLIGCDGLSPANQVNERSKMNTGNFHDVIAFLT